MTTYTAVAIDGPAGAGKSTIARAAAAKLGFIYVDTGALYRTIGLAAQKRGILGTQTAEIIAMLPEIQVQLAYQNGEQRVFLNGEDVSGLIRTPEISRYASQVSAIAQVRTYLLDLQRSLAKTQNVIMDGRDIGTVILPDAQVKIFLTASAETRAKRRYLELTQRGETVSYEQVLAEMQERDAQDITRATAPLKQAADAQRIDTSDLTLEQSIAAICEVIAAKRG